MKKAGRFLLFAVCIALISSEDIFAQESIQPGDSLLLSLGVEYSGEIQWQQSIDSISWEDIPLASSNNYKIEAAIVAYFYRARILDSNCDVYYSEVLKVDPLAGAGFTLMSNGEDPLIVSYTDMDGTVVDYFGKRDENGLPELIDHLMVKSAGDTTRYWLDESGRPIEIYTQDGFLFEFDWLSETVASLAILANDGVTQINTEVDFAPAETRSAEKSVSGISRIGKPLSLSFTETGSLVHQKSVEAAGNCNIYVYSCGEPSDDRVYVSVKSETGLYLGDLPVNRVSKGHYSVTVPTNLAPTANLSDMCEATARNMAKVCILHSVPGETAATALPGFNLQLCAAVSYALSATVVAAPVAAGFLSSCLAVTTGVEYYCNSLGASIGTNASFAEQLCRSEVLNRDFPDDIIITAKILSIPSNYYDNTGPVSGSGPFPDLVFDLGSETSIASLSLSPSSPSNGVGYTASCEISCLLDGSMVSLSVTGSDGYADSAVYPITSNTAGGTFTLGVPGADSGVRDVITLEVTLPNGSVQTRTASLVFN